ncbi:hypothetical protein AAL_02284 [Moelleriella libera RCEF 2490]|uniref:Uncharacterized protein n=1 Tax=Moelleriella libera RCEF 2490 TaxID=1081109 RepID=A0A162IX85_9HYPO|nr:hypothetical protein AAL_02284 [Moelleriella libera RCEF 2490]
MKNALYFLLSSVALVASSGALFGDELGAILRGLNEGPRGQIKFNDGDKSLQKLAANGTVLGKVHLTDVQEAELRTKFFTRMDEVHANAAAQSQSENKPGGLWGDSDDDTFCIPYCLQGVCFDYF